jgi:hypothetical protein
VAEAVKTEDQILDDLKGILQPLPFAPTLRTLVEYIRAEWQDGYDNGYSEGRDDGYWG